MHCGCGNRVALASLTVEQDCPRCNWPMVYALGSGDYALSTHAKLTIKPAAKPRPRRGVTRGRWVRSE